MDYVHRVAVPVGLAEAELRRGSGLVRRARRRRGQRDGAGAACRPRGGGWCCHGGSPLPGRLSRAAPSRARFPRRSGPPPRPAGPTTAGKPAPADAGWDARSAGGGARLAATAVPAPRRGRRPSGSRAAACATLMSRRSPAGAPEPSVRLAADSSSGSSSAAAAGTRGVRWYSAITAIAALGQVGVPWAGRTGERAELAQDRRVVGLIARHALQAGARPGRPVPRACRTGRAARSRAGRGCP